MDWSLGAPIGRESDHVFNYLTRGKIPGERTEPWPWLQCHWLNTLASHPAHRRGTLGRVPRGPQLLESTQGNRRLVRVSAPPPLLSFHVVPVTSTKSISSQDPPAFLRDLTVGRGVECSSAKILLCAVYVNSLATCIQRISFVRPCDLLALAIDH